MWQQQPLNADIRNNTVLSQENHDRETSEQTLRNELCRTNNKLAETIKIN